MQQAGETVETDWLVVGGGVVGTSLAYGLVRTGEQVCLLDEGDDAFRAARGNFGLVWVQSKGAGCPAYARWTIDAAARWPAFAEELAERTGVDVELSQIGGLIMCLDDDELAERARAMASIRAELGGEYPFELLDPTALRELVPQVGPSVAGALYGPLDGHLNPLRLLRALVQAFQGCGGRLCAGLRVGSIERGADGFVAQAGQRRFRARQVVLAAGLGNRALAPMVGLKAPVLPNRGQVLVTERVQPFLRHPSLYVRQTGEGVVQIGDSKEDVGFDDGTTLPQLSRIVARAVKCYPVLERINIVRTWGALRVMSPDGFPIYQASASCPGAFVVTCHSGITLAAQHAGPLVQWLRGGPEPDPVKAFKAERFDVQAH